MKKTIILPFLLLILSLTACANNEAVNNTKNTNKINYANQVSQVEIVADNIEVIHFHGTQQCWSCITVGEYALKTIQEKFPEEYANGTIIYKDINGELPENKDIVIKYQAAGSSLFVNAIMNEKNNIEEDTTVWRLVNDEIQFINYFEDKLKKLLNK